VTTWHLELPFKELWFFGRPYEMDQRTELARIVAEQEASAGPDSGTNA
jgi:hypothetical protein